MKRGEAMRQRKVPDTPSSFWCCECRKQFDCEPTGYDMNDDEDDPCPFLVWLCADCHKVVKADLERITKRLDRLAAERAEAVR